jgi:uncharacterized membrane protein (DUF373 family)
VKTERKFEDRSSHFQAGPEHSLVGAAEKVDRANPVQQTHPTPRRYLELAQDAIVFCLCAMLLVTMGLKLVDLARLLIRGTDFSLVVGDILFILVLVELFRLLLIYLEEHRISVATMVEVGIVATLREVILIGALHIAWQQLLVVCAFILALVIVLRHAGIRAHSDEGAEA